MRHGCRLPTASRRQNQYQRLLHIAHCMGMCKTKNKTTNHRRKIVDQIAERIRSRRESLGLTQRELAKLLGVSKSTPGAWESGRASVRPVLLGKIADVLQTTEAWLRTGRWEDVEPSPHRMRPDEQLLLDAYNALPADLKRLLVNWAEVIAEALTQQGAVIPHLEPRSAARPSSILPIVKKTQTLRHRATSETEGKPADVIPIRFLGDIAAGLPAQAWRQGDMLPVPAHLLEGVSSGQRVGALKVSGDSMAPTIDKGDLVLVREATIGQYRKGDIVAALVDGEETTLKRYVGQRRGVITLSADNPAYEDQSYEPGRVAVQALFVANLTREMDNEALNSLPV